MAIPKTLKVIEREKALRLIEKHLKQGTGEWESSPNYSDFIYSSGKRYYLIRPPVYGGEWETGPLSL